jgi:WD40 repeat protein
MYSMDGRRILSASDDNTIKEWSAETGECIWTYEGYSISVESAVYSADGRKILSGSWDGTIKEWSVETGECIRTYKDAGSVESVVYSHDGRKILSACGNGTIEEWSVETGKCVRTIKNIPGLFIQGCSFKNLHPLSKISDKIKAILKQYGVKFQ